MLRGSWGSTGLHPWVMEQLRKPPTATQPTAEPSTPVGGQGSDVFAGNPDGRGVQAGKLAHGGRCECGQHEQREGRRQRRQQRQEGGAARHDLRAG
ncbi:MAG: hypothetical protein ACK56I_14805, partial [bacterium]